MYPSYMAVAKTQTSAKAGAAAPCLLRKPWRGGEHIN
jgi:hypothetical protein